MPSTEPQQDRTVVLAVVVFLGLIAVGGLAGIVFLIHSGTDATQLLAVSSFAGPATGALAGILATTRTTAPVQQRELIEKAANAGALAAVQQPVAPASVVTGWSVPPGTASPGQAP